MNMATEDVDVTNNTESQYEIIDISAIQKQIRDLQSLVETLQVKDCATLADNVKIVNASMHMTPAPVLEILEVPNEQKQYDYRDKMWELILPEYRGADFEDPVKFIERCAQVLNMFHVPIFCWPGVVSSKLTNDAKSWARAVNEEQPNWDEFVQRFYSRYNGDSLLALLKAKLYGEVQKSGQPLEQFIRRKARLFVRLLPNETRDRAITIIMELMDKKFRPYFRCSPPTNIEELIFKGNQLELDLKVLEFIVGDKTTHSGTVLEGKYIPRLAEHSVGVKKPYSGAVVCYNCGKPGHFSRSCLYDRNLNEEGQGCSAQGNENGSGQNRA